MDDDHSSIIQTQTIITLTKAVTARAIAQCLMFLYTGTIEKEFLKIDVSVLCIILTTSILEIFLISLIQLTLDKTAFLVRIKLYY